MMNLEYRKKPAKPVFLGLFIIFMGIVFVALPFANYFPALPFAGSLFPDYKIYEKLIICILPGLVCLRFGFYLVFSRRKILIDKHSKMVITRKGWVGGLKEKTTDAFPFHSFRSISIGGVKKPGKNTYFYPVLLGMKDIVIPCGSKNKKKISKEIIKISEYMNLNRDKKYSKVSKSVAFKG